MINLNRNAIEDNRSAILKPGIAMKETKSIRMYKQYSVVLKHFQGLDKKNKTYIR
jgi:hypothetical protein